MYPLIFDQHLAITRCSGSYQSTFFINFNMKCMITCVQFSSMINHHLIYNNTTKLLRDKNCVKCKYPCSTSRPLLRLFLFSCSYRSCSCCLRSSSRSRAMRSASLRRSWMTQYLIRINDRDLGVLKQSQADYAILLECRWILSKTNKNKKINKKNVVNKLNY